MPEYVYHWNVSEKSYQETLHVFSQSVYLEFNEFVLLFYSIVYFFIWFFIIIIPFLNVRRRKWENSKIRIFRFFFENVLNVGISGNKNERLTFEFLGQIFEQLSFFKLKKKKISFLHFLCSLRKKKIPHHCISLMSN